MYLIQTNQDIFHYHKVIIQYQNILNPNIHHKLNKIPQSN
jgi:hypothetical protein